ncbi:hypothetical protein MBANPS3_004886 [Mucor bainieri]
MTKSLLTQHIWSNMKALNINIELLKAFNLDSQQKAQNKFKLAIKNVRKRKPYNKRLMGLSISKIEKDFAEFMKSKECKEYFTDNTFAQAVVDEELAREAYKGNIRQNYYQCKLQYFYNNYHTFELLFLYEHCNQTNLSFFHLGLKFQKAKGHSK